MGAVRASARCHLTLSRRHFTCARVFLFEGHDGRRPRLATAYVSPNTRHEAHYGPRPPLPKRDSSGSFTGGIINCASPLFAGVGRFLSCADQYLVLSVNKVLTTDQVGPTSLVGMAEHQPSGGNPFMETSREEFSTSWTDVSTAVNTHLALKLPVVVTRDMSRHLPRTARSRGVVALYPPSRQAPRVHAVCNQPRNWMCNLQDVHSDVLSKPTHCPNLTFSPQYAVPFQLFPSLFHKHHVYSNSSYLGHGLSNRLDDVLDRVLCCAGSQHEVGATVHVTVHCTFNRASRRSRKT